MQWGELLVLKDVAEVIDLYIALPFLNFTNNRI